MKLVSLKCRLEVLKLKRRVKVACKSAADCSSFGFEYPDSRKTSHFNIYRFMASDKVATALIGEPAAKLLTSPVSK